jgi:hypothetical protein
MQPLPYIQKKRSTGSAKSSPSKLRLDISKECASPGVPLFLQRSSAACFSTTEQRRTKDDLTAAPVSPKLIVGPPDDAYEQEADWVASYVMRSSDTGADRIIGEDSSEQDGILRPKAISPPYVTSSCPMCAEEEEDNSSRLDIQPKKTESATNSTKAALAQLSFEGGQPLPDHVRSRIEPVLGRDLSQVRVHSDARANLAARSIQAKAFTHRKDIYLGKGQSAHDVGLMSHEATHVIQQGPDKLRRYAPEDVLQSSITESFVRALGDEDLRLAHGLTVSALTSSGSNRPEREALNSNRTFLAAEAEMRGIDLAEHQELSGNSLDAEKFIPVIYEAEEITLFGLGEPFGEPASSTPEIPALVLPANVGGLPKGGAEPHGIPFISSFGTSVGMSSHMLAMGEHAAMSAEGNLMTMFGPQTGRGAFGQTLRGMTSQQYWGSFVPRPGAIALDRVLDRVPRDLDPYYTIVRTGRPSPGLGLDIRLVANVTDDQVMTIPRLIQQYNAGTISAADRNLLLELARYHANGTPRATPFTSYMVTNTPAPNVGNRLFRVRIRVPANQALNHLFENAEEAEFLLSMDHKGKLTQVSAGTQPMNSPAAGRTTRFLYHHGNKIRWAGRVALVAAAAYGTHRVATAPVNQRGRIAGEEIGGLAAGAAGTVLSGAGCIALGIATGGLALFACGLIGGVALGALGRYAGGEIGDTLQHDAMAPAQWVVDHAVSAWTDPMIKSGDPVHRADGVAIRRVVYQDDPFSLMYLMNRFCGGCMSVPWW